MTCDGPTPAGYSFASRLHYSSGDISDPSYLRKLAVQLAEMTKNGSSPNYLFYVSTSASLAGPLVKGLGAAGLNKRENGWTRICSGKAIWTRPGIR